jgi:NADPH2:quinone reductase
MGTSITMRAAVYGRPGAGDELRVETLPRPEPAAGEVRVRVALSGVNPTDYKTRTGVTPQPIDGFQIAGHDGAGTIDAVGAGVDAARVGQRVWVHLAAFGRRWGTGAEWTVVPAERAVDLPDGAPDALGASLGVPALTAHRCLFANGPLDGRTVLVAGGAGAVGHAAVQLARWAGARVIATAGGADGAERALAAGAHVAVSRRDGDTAERIRAAAPNGVDHVVEVALRANLALDLAVAAPGATVAVYAADAQGDVAVPVRTLMARGLTLQFVLLYTMPEVARSAAVAAVSAALGDGALTPRPVVTYALEQAGEAQRIVAAGHPAKALIALG